MASSGAPEVIHGREGERLERKKLRKERREAGRGAGLEVEVGHGRRSTAAEGWLRSGGGWRKEQQRARARWDPGDGDGGRGGGARAPAGFERRRSLTRDGSMGWMDWIWVWLMVGAGGMRGSRGGK